MVDNCPKQAELLWEETNSSTHVTFHQFHYESAFFVA